MVARNTTGEQPRLAQRGWRIAGAESVLSIALLAPLLAAGCSQVLGLKEPTLSGDDDDGIDAPVVDAPGIDAPDYKLWIFTTNAAFPGDFGVTSGGRTIGDIKCDDMYKLTYMSSRSCTKVHAVLQIDNNIDTLAHMADTFQIPLTAPVLRASDATMVANGWNDLINPNLQLLAPVSTSASVVAFWSGRGVTADRQCNNWQSNSSTLVGDAGDATKRSSWMSQASYTCNDFTPHLLCVCW
jgi:hypothetical protein